MDWVYESGSLENSISRSGERSDRLVGKTSAKSLTKGLKCSKGFLVLISQTYTRYNIFILVSCPEYNK